MKIMLMRLFFTMLFVSERKQIAFMAAEKSPARISQRLFATSRSEMRIIMKLNQIITSLLETDMYKFSMGQAIYHQFSDYKTTWSFKCRNTDVHFTKEVVEEIKEQIKAYCGLRFTEEELEYLHNIKWIKGSYVDFLRLWQPRDRKSVV